MDINIGGSIYTAAYTVESLTLRDFEKVSLGTLLTKHEAQGFNVSYSDLVPTALVADLQEHLSDTVLLLERRIQCAMGSVPDVYLPGNRELMNLVSTVTGTNLGFENGYCINGGQLPGIFMRTEDHLGRVLEWLSLELQASQTQDNVPLRAANAMIPELSARDFTLKRNLSHLKFIFNIPD